MCRRKLDSTSGNRRAGCPDSSVKAPAGKSEELSSIPGSLGRKTEANPCWLSLELHICVLHDQSHANTCAYKLNSKSRLWPGVQRHVPTTVIILLCNSLSSQRPWTENAGLVYELLPQFFVACSRGTVRRMLESGPSPSTASPLLHCQSHRAVLLSLSTPRAQPTSFLFIREHQLSVWGRDEQAQRDPTAAQRVPFPSQSQMNFSVFLAKRTFLPGLLVRLRYFRV